MPKAKQEPYVFCYNDKWYEYIDGHLYRREVTLIGGWDERVLLEKLCNEGNHPVLQKPHPLPSTYMRLQERESQ